VDAVDTLTGIELVEAKAYYAQFDVGNDQPTRRGLALFRANCQFCHGASKVGATFGWDFAESDPMSRYQDSPANLYHNVAYKPRNAGELGLMMPALAFLTLENSADMVVWLRAVSQVAMPPYAPQGSGR
jgi:mono/diheme cytochrome c family protein